MSGFNAVTVSQLAHLIDVKRTEIESIKNSLSIKQLELLSFELLQRRIADVPPEKAWGEFLEWLDRTAPELVVLLKKIQFISLNPGKLFVKAGDIESEMLFYQKTRLENYLKQHFEVDITVGVITDE